MWEFGVSVIPRGCSAFGIPGGDLDLLVAGGTPEEPLASEELTLGIALVGRVSNNRVHLDPVVAVPVHDPIGLKVQHGPDPPLSSIFYVR